MWTLRFLGPLTIETYRHVHILSVTEDNIRKPVHHDDDGQVFKINQSDSDSTNNCHCS